MGQGQENQVKNKHLGKAKVSMGGVSAPEIDVDLPTCATRAEPRMLDRIPTENVDLVIFGDSYDNVRETTPFRRNDIFTKDVLKSSPQVFEAPHKRHLQQLSAIQRELNV